MSAYITSSLIKPLAGEHLVPLQGGLSPAGEGSRKTRGNEAAENMGMRLAVESSQCWHLNETSGQGLAEARVSLSSRG